MMTQKSIKCCLIGDFGSGKTSIANAWLDKTVHNTQATLGIDFFTKNFYVGSENYRLRIWDTAGAERFHSLTHTYVRDSDVVIVVYDLTSRESHIVKWMKMVEQTNAKVVGILGNKIDLERVNRENIDDLVYPWKRQSIKMIQAELTSRNKVACKQFLKLCLLALPQTRVYESPHIHTVQISSPPPKNHMCCT